MKNIIIALIVIVVIVAGIAVTFVLNTQPTVTPSPSALVTSAPLISTTPTATTAVSIPSGWQTATDTTTQLSFNYPPDLGTTYIQATDWPPKLQLVNQPFSCTAAGSPIAQGGQTREQSVNNHTYCVTEESGGAAGSVYTHYAYATVHNQQTAILTFSLRFPQCANYESTQKICLCPRDEGSDEFTQPDD